MLINMFIRTFTALWLILIFTLNGSLATIAQDNLNVLNPDFYDSQENEMMRKYLRDLSAASFEKRSKRLDSLNSTDEIKAYQKEMHEFLLDKLNFPERTPLNARTVEKVSYTDYTLEKIIYESQPGIFVTSLLYLPTSPPPYPGVLVLAGHGETGKAHFQQMAVNLARNGMAALCPDPLGQSERKQILNENGKGIYRATSEHMIEGIAPILLGQSIATHMVWDGIRALDYLVSRSEIDTEKIGCIGHSGGGNRTSYLMAIDDRIKCASPSCFITTIKRKNDFPGPGDAEQNIHGQIAFGMEHADYVIMRAPKPTLIMSAAEDFVPIEGAWEAFREAKQVYSKMGYSERVELVEGAHKHELSATFRVAALRWMSRWLLGSDKPLMEAEFIPVATDELNCTPEGQVLLLPGARPVFELYAEKEKQLAAVRANYLKDANIDEVKNKIRELASIRKYDALPEYIFEEKETINRNGYSVQKGLLNWDNGITLPYLLFKPGENTVGYCLYLHGEGKHVDAGVGGKIEELVLAGNTILVPDLRGIGETSTTPWRYKDAHTFTGHDVAEFYIAYMIGKSFLGMRVEDILISAKYLKSLMDDGNESAIKLIAHGVAGPPALHAAALEPDFFGSTELNNSLISWKSITQTSLPKNALVNTVHNALSYYDLPDLISIAGQDKIIINNPVNASGEPVDREVE